MPSKLAHQASGYIVALSSLITDECDVMNEQRGGYSKSIDSEVISGSKLGFHCLSTGRVSRQMSWCGKGSDEVLARTRPAGLACI